MSAAALEDWRVRRDLLISEKTSREIPAIVKSAIVYPLGRGTRTFICESIWRKIHTT